MQRSQLIKQRFGRTLKACLAGAAPVLVAVLVAACGSSAPTLPHRAGKPPLSIFEADAQLDSNASAGMAELKAMGVQVARISLYWSTVAPDPTSDTKPALDLSDPASYPATGWAMYDEIDRAAAAKGVELYVTLTSYAPRWAAGPGAPSNPAQAARWRPSAADFAEYVHAVGERYSGNYTPAGASSPLPRIHFWSIWNEPNYGTMLAPQTTGPGNVEISPRLYRGLLNAGWNALAATGHTTASDTILVGETAPFGVALPGLFREMAPVRFVRALYCVGDDYKPLRGDAATQRGCPVTAAGSAKFNAQNPALFHASGWADHPYTNAGAPSQVSAGSEDFAYFAAIPNLEHGLDHAAAAYGADPHFPIYSTEYGYLTDPPKAGEVSPTTAAIWLNETEFLTWLSPRIDSYDQYQLTDPAPGYGANFDTGLKFYNGQPKPGYAAYLMPLWMPLTSASTGSKLDVWGCARPAPNVQRSTGRPQRVLIQFAPTGAGYRTVRTVTLHQATGCYFDVGVAFPGTGSVRLAYDGSGAPMYSRVQPISLG